MTSRIRHLSSTTSYVGDRSIKILSQALLVGAALQVIPLAPALAQDAPCQMTKSYTIQMPPDLCSRLGGTPSPPESSPPASAADDALYKIWKESAEHDKAYAIAQAYLKTFPDGAHAEELRQWSSAYETVMARPGGSAEAPQPQTEARSPAAAPAQPAGPTAAVAPEPPQTDTRPPAAAPQPPQTEARAAEAPPQTTQTEARAPAETPQPPQTEARVPDAASEQPQTDARTPAEMEAEFAAWKSIEKSRKAADFQAYIERYPDGEFTTSARRRLAALETAARSARRASVPEHDQEPPVETVTIDGQTYVKGREPKNIGTVPLQALDSYESGRYGYESGRQ